MKVFSESVCILLCLAMTGTIYAQGTLTLTFDDFSLLPGEGRPMPNGYASLQWINFCNSAPMDWSYEPFGSGFLNAVVSPNNVVWNGSGDPAKISSSTPFDLVSAYMTAAWMDGLQIEAQGFTGTTLAYANTYTINPTSPTLIVFNYSGVDQVTFIASGGTPHYFAGEGSIFVMDNMTISVPEPSDLTLAFLSIVVLVGLAKRPPNQSAERRGAGGLRSQHRMARSVGSEHF